MFIMQKSPEVSVGVFKNHLGEPLVVASGMIIGTVEEVSKMLRTYKEGVIKLEAVPIENAYHGALQATDLSGIDFAGLAFGLRSLADWLQDASKPKSAQGATERPASTSRKSHNEAEWNKYLGDRIDAFGRWMEGKGYDGPDVRIAREIGKLDEVFRRKNTTLDETLIQGSDEKCVGH